MKADPTVVREYLLELQARFCSAFEELEGEKRFVGEEWKDADRGLSLPRVLTDGAIIERAAVNFSHTLGDALPGAATVRRPDLAGHRFEAVSLSLIAHPRNPHVPTTHANFRFFVADKKNDDPVWWFGGGFDLTPYYGYEEDAVHWHENAQEACRPFGKDVYPQFKRACDKYFYLPHRDETRGVGGLFFDDLSDWGFETTFAFLRSAGDRFLPGYLPILERRKAVPYGDREREFQLYRRGRYVEFNLIYDRGTLYGLQAGRRIEAVLASMPPRVRWEYDWQPEPGSAEADLYEKFLKPRDWLTSA